MFEAHYGLNAFVFAPPISLFISLLLFWGIGVVGFKAGMIFLNFSHCPTLIRILISPALGATVVAFAVAPFVIFSYYLASLLTIAGWSLIGVGLLSLFGGLQKRNLVSSFYDCKITEKGGFFSWILIVFLSLYFLISLAPITDADSLCYHVGVPVQVLATGEWPFQPEWFHSRLAGVGEMLIAMSLAVGGEQFGSLMQYAGLLAIVGVLLPIGKREQNEQYIYSLLFVSSPVLLMLVSSSKPQLLPVAMTTFALALLFHPVFSCIENKNNIKKFLIFSVLLGAACQMKFNFILSSFFIGIAGLVWMRRKKLLLSGVILGMVVGIIIFAPFCWWKLHYYGGDVLQAFVKPFPGGWIGYDKFDSFLRGYRDSPLPFPISLFVPASLGLISTTIGFGGVVAIVVVICAFFNSKHINIWIILIACVVFVGGTIFGQGNARFYLEPVVWVLMGMLIGNWMVSIPRYMQNVVSLVIVLQCMVMLMFVLYGVVSLFPGSLSVSLRDMVLSRSAPGYEEMVWADSILPKNAVIGADTRSMAFMPRYAVGMDWIAFVSDNDRHMYIDILKEKKVSHYVVQGNPGEHPLREYFTHYLAGPFKAHKATRNPFNSGDCYDVHVVEVKF